MDTINSLAFELGKIMGVLEQGKDSSEFLEFFEKRGIDRGVLETFSDQILKIAGAFYVRDVK